jgi:hypothetical protein
MTNQLVLQFHVSSIDDYDAIIAAEELVPVK